MSESMTCRQGLGVLMDYSEGVLPGTLRRNVEAHVEECHRCRKFVRSYGETPRILRDATAETMPATTRRALHQAIAVLPRRRRERRK